MAFAVLFFSGCVDVGIEQEIREDGSSDVIIKYDISVLVNSANEFGGDSQSEELSELCEDEEGLGHVKELGFACSVTDEGIITLMGEWQVTSEFFEFEESLTKITYKYDALGIFDLLSKVFPSEILDLGDIGATDDSEKNFADSMSQFETFGAKMTYIITLPAEIESSEVGIFSENKVTIDVFDLEDRDTAVIVASKINPLVYYVGASAGIVLLVLVIMIIVGIRRKSRIRNISSPSESDEMSEEELVCKEYILKYKSEHSRDSISKGLVNHGVAKKKVNEYLDKYF